MRRRSFSRSRSRSVSRSRSRSPDARAVRRPRSRSRSPQPASARAQPSQNYAQPRRHSFGGGRGGGGARSDSRDDHRRESTGGYRGGRQPRDQRTYNGRTSLCKSRTSQMHTHWQWHLVDIANSIFLLRFHRSRLAEWLDRPRRLGGKWRAPHRVHQRARVAGTFCVSGMPELRSVLIIFAFCTYFIRCNQVGLSRAPATASFAHWRAF